MGGAGWSLKGPQPRLQESLASSFAPVCSTHRSPPPFLLLLPACQACRWTPFRLSPPALGSCLDQWVPLSSVLVPMSPEEWGWGVSSDPQVLCPLPAGVGARES